MAAQPLTRNQLQSSVIAGAVAHTIFQTGWFAFGMSLAALIATALFGNIVTVISGAIGGAEAGVILGALGGGSDIVVWIVVAFLVASLVLIGLSILVSGWILSAAGQNRAGRVTMSAIGIAALVDVAMFWVYLGLANLIADGRLIGPLLLTPLIALVGGIILGALLWWLMAFANREKVSAATAVVDAAVPLPQGNAE